MSGGPLGLASRAVERLIVHIESRPPAGPLRIGVSAIVSPSEVGARVRDAVLRIFPGAGLETRPHHPAGWSLVEGEAPSLDRFAEIIAQTRIRDAARAVMLRGARGGDGTRTRFFLSKQAALGGRVNFAEEGVLLGPIIVEVEGEGLTAKIDEITTRD